MNGLKTIRVFPVLASILLLAAFVGLVLIFILLLQECGDGVSVYDMTAGAGWNDGYNPGTEIAFFSTKTAEAIPTQTPYFIIVTATPDESGTAIRETTVAATATSRIEILYLTATHIVRTATQVALDMTATASPATDVATVESAQYSRDCQLPGNEYVILNANPCLDNPVLEQQQPEGATEVTVQHYPETYRLWNRHETWETDGVSWGERQTEFIPIDVDDEGYRFDVSSVAGEAGFMTTFTLHESPEAKCVIVQAFGTYHIEDPQYATNRDNYALRVWIPTGKGKDFELGIATMPAAPNGDIDPYWTISLNGSGEYTFGISVLVQNPTAPTGSWVRLESIAIAENPDWRFCDRY